MSWENALLMKFSNDVDRCEIEETKWVKTTHLFIVRTAMEYAMNFDITAVGNCPV